MVAETLRSGWLVNGPRVAAFERALALRCGARHAVAVSSGTAALTLALEVAGIGPGDRVIVPAFTYLATAHAVALVGAEPVLVDVDPGSWNIDVAAVGRELEGDQPTAGLLPVDQFGLPADLAALRALTASSERRPVLIDDAACALGATRDGRPCTADADLACFSFHPRKVITTGEGGAVLVEDDELAARLRRLRNHGRDAAGTFVEVAGNQRMSELAGALGCSQLSRLDQLLEQRQRLAARYRQRLEAHPALTLQQVTPDLTHSYQTFAVCLSEPYPRQRVLAALQSRGVEATIGTFALHLERPYAAATGRDLPVAERLARHCLALPLHPALALEQVDTVCRALEEALATVRR